MKAKSDMPFHFKYVYKLSATAKEFYFIKGRPGHVLWVDYISVYNPTESNYTHLYLMDRDHGEVSHCDYVASLNTILVKKFAADHYLKDGEELGIKITGAAEGDLLEVTVHGLRMIDEDYFKAT